MWRKGRHISHAMLSCVCVCVCVSVLALLQVDARVRPDVPTLKSQPYLNGTRWENSLDCPQLLSALRL